MYEGRESDDIGGDWCEGWEFGSDLEMVHPEWTGWRPEVDYVTPGRRARESAARLDAVLRARRLFGCRVRWVVREDGLPYVLVDFPLAEAVAFSLMVLEDARRRRGPGGGSRCPLRSAVVSP